MFKGEFKFDLQDALRQSLHCQPQYCDAYHTTNEPIEEWLPLTPVKNPRVLTVAASGDQPLLYAANGAAHIDTFDLTINACAIMDFKTAAIQSMNFSEYMDAVHVLGALPKMKKGDPRINTIFNIIRNMPQRTQALMCNTVLWRPSVFSKQFNNKPRFPQSAQRYKQIQETIRAPFNFIWADLANISHYINDQYDIINISNIFDHYLWARPDSAQAIFNTIQSLCPYLNVNGYLLCTTTSYETLDILDLAPKRMPNLDIKISFYDKAPMAAFCPIVIQKTR